MPIRSSRIDFFKASKSVGPPNDFKNSSFNSGKFFALMSFKVTLNSTGLPASSAAWYGSGNFKEIVLFSPFFMPTMPSSKPSMNCFAPNSRWWSLPEPFSRGAPPMKPSKSTTAVSPILAARSSVIDSKDAREERMFSRTASTFFSSKSIFSFSTSRPSYFFKTISGRTSKFAENAKSFSSLGSANSNSG
ncbi:hypothetical protein D3C87_1240580 [compost metagenome]